MSRKRDSSSISRHSPMQTSLQIIDSDIRSVMDELCLKAETLVRPSDVVTNVSKDIDLETTSKTTSPSLALPTESDETSAQSAAQTALESSSAHNNDITLSPMVAEVVNDIELIDLTQIPETPPHLLQREKNSSCSKTVKTVITQVCPDSGKETVLHRFYQKNKYTSTQNTGQELNYCDVQCKYLMKLADLLDNEMFDKVMKNLECIPLWNVNQCVFEMRDPVFENLLSWNPIRNIFDNYLGNNKFGYSHNSDTQYFGMLKFIIDKCPELVPGNIFIYNENESTTSSDTIVLKNSNVLLTAYDLYRNDDQYRYRSFLKLIRTVLECDSDLIEDRNIAEIFVKIYFGFVDRKTKTEAHSEYEEQIIQLNDRIISMRANFIFTTYTEAKYTVKVRIESLFHTALRSGKVLLAQAMLTTDHNQLFSIDECDEWTDNIETVIGKSGIEFRRKVDRKVIERDYIEKLWLFSGHTSLGALIDGLYATLEEKEINSSANLQELQKPDSTERCMIQHWSDILIDSINGLLLANSAIEYRYLIIVLLRRLSRKKTAINSLLNFAVHRIVCGVAVLNRTLQSYSAKNNNCLSNNKSIDDFFAHLMFNKNRLMSINGRKGFRCAELAKQLLESEGKLWEEVLQQSFELLTGRGYLVVDVGLDGFIMREFGPYSRVFLYLTDEIFPTVDKDKSLVSKSDYGQDFLNERRNKLTKKV